MRGLVPVTIAVFLPCLLLVGCGESQTYEHVTYETPRTQGEPDFTINVGDIPLTPPVEEPLSISTPAKVPPNAILLIQGNLLPREPIAYEQEILLLLIYKQVKGNKQVFSHDGGGYILRKNGKHKFSFKLKAPGKKGSYQIKIFQPGSPDLITLASGTLVVD